MAHNNTVVDTYAHIGYPRYGTPEELMDVWKQAGISEGCVALPPGMPDFGGLRTLMDALGSQVRVFGIPYGPDAQSRAELTELQIRFGISGMRFMPDEIVQNEDTLNLLGEAGKCLMGINIYDRAEATQIVLDWLTQYPNATVAAPHFLKPSSLEEGADDPAGFRELLGHPRFYVIFSRHGGASRQAYPHEDLRPWVEEVRRLVGPSRILWGSEIPVLFHRDENLEQAQGWLETLCGPMSSEEREAYLYANARRLFFQQEAPKAEDITFPDWVAEGLADFIRRNEPVPVIRTKPLELPLDLHGSLMSAYLSERHGRPKLEFRAWLAERLSRTQ
jgi:hypothetical protein